MKTLRQILESSGTDIELKLHGDGKHYIVHKINRRSGIGSDQLKTGEKLTDTHVDDLRDSGYKVKIHSNPRNPGKPAAKTIK